MSEPSAPAAEPGDRPPGRLARRLEQAPSKRFQAAADTPETAAAAHRAWRRRWLIAGLGCAAGGLAVVLLVGVFGLTSGLLFVAGASGLAIGSQVPTRPAVLLAISGVVAGDVGTWLYARWEGGVLDLPAYTLEIFGAGNIGQVLVAGLAAAIASERIRTRR